MAAQPSTLSPQLLREHFHRIAEAPDAIPRLRRFILDLAVRGKLVEQAPTDESVSHFIECIEAEKGRLARDGKLRGSTTVTLLGTDEAPFAIPASWAWVLFGDVMLSRDGERIPVSKDERSGRAKTYDYYGASGVIDKIDSYLFDKPLLLIGEDGANLINRSTPIAFIARGKYWVNNHAHVLDGISESFLRFIELHINAIDLKPYVTGTAQPKMNQAKMNSIPIALPPMAEQQRIVAKVDELMALCDRLEAAQAERENQRARLAATTHARIAAPALDRSDASFFIRHLPRLTTRPEQIKQLRQTILTLAVQGKLVPQDPNDEPAEEILAGIAGDVAKAVRAKRMRNSRSIPEYEEKFPFGLPAGWAWAPLGTLTAAEDGAMCDGPFGSKLKTEHYIPTKGYAVLRLGNIGVGYFIHGKEGHISRERFQSLPSNHTAPGDLLVAGLADPLVRCCEIPPDIGPAVNKSDCFRVRLSKRMDRSYVRHYLNSPIAKAFAAEENHGMTRERINLANAKALPVSVPPLAEQRRIVTRVNELMALCNQLEVQLTTTQTESHRLLEAVLHNALQSRK